MTQKLKALKLLARKDGMQNSLNVFWECSKRIAASSSDCRVLTLNMDVVRVRIGSLQLGQAGSATMRVQMVSIECSRAGALATTRCWSPFGSGSIISGEAARGSQRG